jgi:hypothetical protein
VGIQGRDWIIKKDHVWNLVDCTSQTDSCLLTSRKIDSFLSNFGVVARRKDQKVIYKLARLDDFGVLSLIKFASKKNVVSESGILDPMLLLNISQSSIHLDWRVLSSKLMGQECLLKSFLLSFA